jgi:capsular exopolysaccharide synthesis family protein
MDENMRDKHEEAGVDLQRLMGELLKRAWIVILAAVAGAVISFLCTFYLVTPLYESSAMFYVNNKSFSVGGASVSLESGDISAAKSLVDSYIVILTTRESLNDVIDYAEVSRSYGELKEMITAAAVNSTEIFEVVVTSPDPFEAERIATAIAYISPKRISSIIEGTSAKVVDAAVVAAKPSSPSYVVNTLTGFLLGFVMAVSLLILRELFDITIRSEEDITQICKHPILAAVPDMTAQTKGGYYYSAYANASPKANTQRQPALVGSEINFAASEAYKLLRTKLQFSFAGENDCRIIGLSSALSGEGKSLSSVNLAYTLSQLDKRVLLIDCDMRRPSLSAKLPIQKAPGLSNYLTRQCSLSDLLQVCKMKENENAFHVITAGQSAPNPVELLSSERMSKALDTMRRTYDYVILDLPPVGEVSDALAIAKQTDGILLVVRQNYCDRVVLTDTVKQFDFINAKTLGVVFNAIHENGGKGYYNKKYYRRYYHRYGKSYGKSYENNDREVMKPEGKTK